MKVFSGIYSISYCVMIPFLSIAVTLSQLTIMAVDERTMASTLVGGESGTVHTIKGEESEDIFID